MCCYGKRLSIKLFIGIILTILTCSCSHDIDITGAWTRHVNNEELSISADETYYFLDNDSLIVTSKYKFLQEDEDFKCSYEFGTTYKTITRIDRDSLIFEYLPSSFVFYPKDKSFKIIMKRDGNEALLDSLKSEMRETLTNFFKEEMSNSFDSLCRENRSFKITQLTDNTLLLTSGNYEINLNKI